MASPLPHQVKAIDQNVSVLSRHGASVEASGTGVGKTFIALFVAQRFRVPVAIVCPKSVIPAWEEAARDVGVPLVFCTNYEQVKSKKFAHGRWKVKNRVYSWSLAPGRCILIFDEVHRCKSRTTQNAKLLIAARRQNINVLMLSATLAENPLEMYATGFVLGLHSLENYWGWACSLGVKMGGFAYEFRGTSDDLARLHASIFPEHGHRLRWQEIPGFPDNQVATLPVDLGPEHAKYAEVADRIAALEDQRKLDPQLPVVELLRARQHAELLKARTLADLAQDFIAEGNSVAIFVNFRETLFAIAERLGIDCAVVYGGQETAERTGEIEAFQSNKATAIVLMIQAGGEGVSLHDLHGRPRVSIISPPQSAVQLRQALGRIHRVNAKSPAVQRLVFVSGTVEEGVRRKVEGKLNNIDLINDSDLLTGSILNS